MAILQERLQILLPKGLKGFLKRAARERGLSVGEYIRRLVEAERQRSEKDTDKVSFPFGEKPIRTGRKTGSIDHDRPGT